MARRDTFAFMERGERQFMRHTDIETTGDEVFDEHIASQWKTLRLKERDFGDVFDVDEREKDMEYLEKVKRGFEDKETESSRGLHTAVMEGISQYDWLGPDANVVYTTEFDDVANGTDFVVCFEQEHGPSIKIGVDVTTSESRVVLKKKLERINQQLELNGWLPHIKYFEYPDAGNSEEPRGTIDLPRVILGTDSYNTQELIKSFSAALQKKGDAGREARRKLGEEQFQHELLREILAQLAFQLEASVKKFEDMPPEDCPESVNGLLDWIYDTEHPATHRSDEAMEQLASLISSPEEGVPIQFRSHLASAKKIGHTMVYLHALQKEKGAGIQPDASDSLTARHLSRPKELFS